MPAFLPGERELASVRQHWVVIFATPRRWALVVLAVLLVVALLDSRLVTWAILTLAVLLPLGWRWYNWREERIVLTSRRIIRLTGVPETTELEAYLRIDRISGVVLVQSLGGKLLDYGTLHLEAPGDHPTLRRLEKVAQIGMFYRRLRSACFADDGRTTEPDEVSTGRHARPPDPGDFITQPLPPLPAPRQRGRRGR